jgi:integrase
MLTENERKHPMRRACRRAVLRSIGWHTPRFTFASHLVVRGAPLKAVQELLGHADIQITMRYLHLFPHVKRDAVALLDGTILKTAQQQRAILCRYWWRRRESKPATHLTKRQ